MELINRLLKQKKVILTEKNIKYDKNRDHFFEALGVDPEKYRIDYPDGTYEYDAIRALRNIDKEMWKEK